MTISQHDDKDVSKIFSFLRGRLQAKEKQLLELQRTDPSLLAPDLDQIDLVIDAIASLHLASEDGTYVFASSANDDDDCSSYTSVCSAEFNAIKSLPLSVWLPESRPVKHQIRQQPSIFSHLLSLPIDAYLASSWPSTFQTTGKTSNQFLHHIPMVSHLLCMPLNTFKPSFNTSAPIEIENNKTSQNNVAPTTTEKTTKSLLNSGTVFSKEFWTQNSQNMSCRYKVPYYT